MIDLKVNTKSTINTSISDLIGRFTVENLEVYKKCNSVECTVKSKGYSYVSSDYTFCLTCDPEMKEKICKECSIKCHAEHTLKKYFQDNTVCYCGLNNHKIQVSNFTNDDNNQFKCVFSEWASISKLFYRNKHNKKYYCVFCSINCLKESTQKKLEQHKIESDDNQMCECNSELHNDSKRLIKMVGNLKVSDLPVKGYYNQTNILNLIFESKNSFNKIFSSFIKNVETLKEMMSSRYYSIFQITETLCHNLMSLTMQSFLKMASSINYFSKHFNAGFINDLFKHNFIFLLLNKDYDFTQSKTLYVLLDIFKLYHEYIFVPMWSIIPTISIIDIVNLNPMQRLIRLKNSENLKINEEMYDLNKINRDIIVLLKTFEKYIAIKPSKKKALFQIIDLLLKQILKYSSYNLIKYKVFIKFCNLINDFIYNISNFYPNLKFDSSISPPLLNCMYTLSEIFLYSIYYYNDQITYMFLKNSKNIDLIITIDDESINNVKFFHNLHEISSIINLNVINSFNVLKSIEFEESNENLVKTTLHNLHFVYSLSLKTQENYYISLVKLIDKDSYYLKSIICDDIGEDEKNFLSKIKLSEQKFNSYLDNYYFQQNSIYSISNLITDCKKQLFVVVNELKLNLNYSFDLITSILNLDPWIEKSNLKELKNSLKYEKYIDKQNQENEKIKLSKDDFDINNDYLNFALEKIKENNNFNDKNFYKYFKLNFKTTNSENSEVKHSYKLLLYGTNIFYIFYKVLIAVNDNIKYYENIDHEEGNTISEQTETNVFIIEQIIELFDHFKHIIFFFIKDSPSNCIFILNSDFFNFINKIEKTYLKGFLEIVYYSIFIISISDLEISETGSILKFCVDLIGKLGTETKETEESIEEIILLTRIVELIFGMENFKKDNSTLLILIHTLNNIFSSEFRNMITEFKNFGNNDINIFIGANNNDNNKVLNNIDLNNQNNSINKTIIENNNSISNISGLLDETSKKNLDGDFLLNKLNNHNMNNFINRNEDNLNPNSDNNEHVINKRVQLSYKHCIYKLFIKFLKLINSTKKSELNTEDLEFFSSILTTEDIVKLLQIKVIDIKLRIEILKFLKLLYIDLSINIDNIQDYITIIVNKIDTVNNINFNESMQLFMKNLFEINRSLDTIEMESSLFKYELKNINSIIENTLSIDLIECKDIPQQKKLANSNIYAELLNIEASENLNNRELIFEYICNGILIPLNSFWYKLVTETYLKNGYENLKIYEIVILLFQLKQNLMKHFLTTDTELSKDLFNKFYSRYKAKMTGKYFINFDNFNEENYSDLNSDYEIMTGKVFEILNFKKIYKYFSKHFSSFFSENHLSKPDFDPYFQKNQFDDSYILNQDLISQFKKFDLITNGEYEEKVLALITHYQVIKLDAENNSIIVNMSEQNIQFSKSNRILLLRSILVMMTLKTVSEEYLYSSLWDILKFLQIETSENQEEIQNLLSSHNNDLNLSFFSNLFVINLLNLVFNSNNIDEIQDSKSYFYSCNIIKIMKFLCEEHNVNFQRIFFRELNFVYTHNYTDDQGNELSENVNISLFNFILCLLAKILLLSNWLNTSIDIKESDYYYNLYTILIEFCIEMIQGTSSINLKTIIANEYNPDCNMLFDYLTQAKPLISRINSNELISKAGLDTLNLIMSFLEEKNSPNIISTNIFKVISPIEVMTILISKMKSIYKKNNGIETNRQSNEKSDDEVFFDENLTKYFNNLYKEDMDFYNNNISFKICNRMYQFIKIAEVNFNNDDAIKLIKTIKNNNFNKMSNSLKNKIIESKNSNLAVEQFDEEIYFCVSFFEEITNTIDIFVDDKNVSVIFTQDPHINYLSSTSFQTFLDNTSRENRFIKLYSLMEYAEFIFVEVQYNFQRIKKNKFMKYLNNLNYYYIEIICAFFTLLINLILVINLKYFPLDDYYNLNFIPTNNDLTWFRNNSNITSTNITENSTLINTTSNRTFRFLEEGATKTISTSSIVLNSVYDNEFRDPKNIVLAYDENTNDILVFIISIIAIISIAINLFGLVSWLFIKLKLYYFIETKKYKLKLEKEKNRIDNSSLSTYEKIKLLIFDSILMKNEINAFIINIIFSTIAIFTKSHYYMFGFQMITILNLHSATINILKAIFYYIFELSNVFFLLQLVIYLHGFVAFFILNENFLQMIVLKNVSNFR